MYTRRRGTAIVESPSGILVVRERDNRFSLPGGGANQDESREEAAIRELREETGLETLKSEFLFEHLGRKRRSHHGGLYRDDHKVFFLTTTGIPRPGKEVAQIAYFDGANIELEPTAKDIINRYLAARTAQSRSNSPGSRGGRLRPRRRVA